MKPLGELLSRPGREDEAVSLRGETGSTFARDVRRLRSRLERAEDARPGVGYVLATNDSYAFAVGLFGLWQASMHAVLPPNRQDGTLAALEAETAGLITDVPGWLSRPLAIDPLAEVADADDAPTPLAPLSDDTKALALFTSGTTGANRAIDKQIRHLDREVAELERIFGPANDVDSAPRVPADASIFSTAPPAHLYGLLFGVLWPLASGRRFCPDALQHPSEILPRLERGRPSVLVSVPSALRQIARHDAGSLSADACAAVFSSGGPLPRETALATEARLGNTPVEVFGSTETGGVAWRRRRADTEDPAWTPFPSVSVDVDDEQRLRVTSPFVSGVDADTTRRDRFTMGDRARFESDGRFRVEGRTDDVVKIAEKRVDLARMSEALRAHAGVEDAALVTIGDDGPARIGAVIVATAEGRARIAADGPEALQRTLRASLREHFDPVVHPRAWRLVDALPIDERGKLARAALRALFRAPGAATHQHDVSDRPETKEALRGEDHVERTCRVPTDLECFVGHFPDQPVVPGVLQLDWALDAAEELLGHVPRVSAVESIKLVTPLRPGDTFRIHVHNPEPDLLRIEVASESAPHLKARVRLSPMAEQPRSASRLDARTTNDVDVTLVIPIFDHGGTIRAVVEELERFDLPCLIVNDGSGEDTRRALAELEALFDWVEVVHHSENRGRGAALRTAYETAAARGRTHALQLDADGQHESDDVPRFLDAVKSTPEALVLGAPIFDETIPFIRLHGRKLSKYFVDWATASDAVTDPLCGFRCIPLRRTLEVLAQQPTGDRMDFDPELIIRLVRSGVPVVNVPTEVRYPENGVSHFRLVEDNVLIVKAYLRLARSRKRMVRR